MFVVSVGQCIVHRTVWLDITNQFSLVITGLDALETFQFGDIYIYWEERKDAEYSQSVVPGHFAEIRAVLPGPSDQWVQHFPRRNIKFVPLPLLLAGWLTWPGPGGATVSRSQCWWMMSTCSWCWSSTTNTSHTRRFKESKLESRASQDLIWRLARN